jgi:hypothetical protein
MKMGCSMIYFTIHVPGSSLKKMEHSGVSLSKLPLLTSSELPCPVAFQGTGGQAPRVQQHQRQTQQHVQGAAQAVAIDAWIEMASRCICVPYLDMYMCVCV